MGLYPVFNKHVLIPNSVPMYLSHEYAVEADDWLFYFCIINDIDKTGL